MFEINFLESDYSIVEGSTEFSSPIIIQLRQNQNPFTLMLSPVTIDTAESKNLSFFINSPTILPTSRATAGIGNVHHITVALIERCTSYVLGLWLGAGALIERLMF